MALEEEFHPKPDDVDRLLQQLVSTELPRVRPLTDGYHRLCDEEAVSGRRIEARDTESRSAIEDLAARFKEDVLRNVEEDRYLRPERVADRVLILEAQVLSSGSYYSFYAEITNVFGDWLTFVDRRCHRYSTGPVAMRVTSLPTTGLGYGYDLLFSREAFTEDLERIAAQGLDLLYDDPGSLLLPQAYGEVEHALEAAGAPFARITSVDVQRRRDGHILMFATEGGLYQVAASVHPTRATLRLLCTAAE